MSREYLAARPVTRQPVIVTPTNNCRRYCVDPISEERTMTNYIELSDIATLVNGAEADEKKMVADSAGSLLRAVIGFTNSDASTPEEKVWFSGTLTETLRTATRDGARAIDTGAATPPAPQQGLGASKPALALNGSNNSNSDAADAEIAELKKQRSAATGKRRG